MRIIPIQAASFSLFMILSKAWTEFFEAVTESFLSTAELGRANSIWISLTRALASTICCVFLLFFILFLFGKRSKPRQRVIVLRTRRTQV